MSAKRPHSVRVKASIKALASPMLTWIKTPPIAAASIGNRVRYRPSEIVSMLAPFERR
jgi:hypothetical protein